MKNKKSPQLLGFGIILKYSWAKTGIIKSIISVFGISEGELFKLLRTLSIVASSVIDHVKSEFEMFFLDVKREISRIALNKIQNENSHFTQGAYGDRKGIIFSKKVTILFSI